MKKLIYLLILTLNSMALNFDVDALKTKGYQIYKIQAGETLTSISNKLHKELNYKFQSLEDFKRFLVQWNPHLKKVSKLTGQYIYINNPYPPQLSYKWAPDLTLSEDEAMATVDFVNIYHGVNENKRSPASLAKKTSWVRFIHASLSQGKFLDTIGSNKIDSQQNSPFTVGAGFVYLMEDYKNYSIASSIYYSNLQTNNINDASNTVTNKNLKLPAEVGVNVYLQKNLQSLISNVYGGIDYEEFNTLNFDQIIEGNSQELSSQRQKFTYLTAGLGLSFNFIKPSTMKFSASQALATSTDLSGSKFMIYFNQKISNNFWYHLLYKQHLLTENDRDVSISRYGIGVGMAF